MIPTQDKVSVSYFSNLFGCISLDELIEENIDFVFQSVYESLKAEDRNDPNYQDKCDDEADKYWEKIVEAYYSALNTIFTYLSEECGVTCLLVKESNSITFDSPSWEEALNIVLDSIHGVGAFHFEDGTDLINSGPYDGAKGAVIHHIHWHACRGEIYGSQSITAMFKDRLNSLLGVI